MIDLSTDYMGIKLKNPIIAASSSLTSSLDGVKRCEKAGAGAVVLKSLFEEQITFEKNRMIGGMNFDAHADAYDFFNESGTEYYLNEYLDLVEKAKKNLSIPVFASINCVSPGQWVKYSERFENVGADALELNTFILPSDVKTEGKEIEKRYFDILSEVKKRTKLPVAVKIGYHFSGLGNFISRISESGADGIVLFNRFYKIDIDTEKLSLKASPIFSEPSEMHLSLQWVALMSGEIKADLSGATGIYDGISIAKHLLAGAKTTQLCSVLMKNGVGKIEEIKTELMNWMESKGFNSISDFQGILCQENSSHPEAYERSQYIKTVVGIA